MRATKLTVLVLAAAAVIGLAGAGRASEDGQVVSVATRDFAAAHLGRKGFDLLMEKNGRVFSSHPRERSRPWPHFASPLSSKRPGSFNRPARV